MPVQLRSLFALFTLCALFTLFIPYSTAQAATSIIRVAPSGTDSPACGAADNPCRTITYAITRTIVTGDVYDGEVRVAAGTYTASGESVVRFTGRGSIAIKGGYTTTNFDTSNPTANPTIIDGQNARRGVTIAVGSTIPCTVAIEGFTVRNGRATPIDGVTTTFGGGILVDFCTLTLRDMIVTDNIAQGASGAAATSVQSAGAGGGIAARGFANNNVATVPVRLNLYNVRVQNNQALGTSNISPRGGIGFGGGVYVFAGIVTADNLVLEGNTAQGGNSTGSGATGIQFADGGGGGMAIIVGPSLNLNNVTMTNNTAQGGNAGVQGAYGLGGGLKTEFVTNGRITNSRIDSNTVIGGNGSLGGTGQGGGLFNTDSDLTLDAVTIIRNRSIGQDSGGTPGSAGGGGITTTRAQRQVASTLVLNNTLLAGNSVQRGQGSGVATAYGAGIYCTGTNLTANHTTIANNTIPGLDFKEGPAMVILDTCTAVIRNSIVANHSFPRAPIYINPNAGSVTLNRNLFFNNGGSGNYIASGSPSVTEQNSTAGDPLFINTGSYDFHIEAQSAAKDKAVGSTTSSDIDGDARPFNGIADLGADEYSNVLQVSIIEQGSSALLTWKPLTGITVTGYQVIGTPGLPNPVGTLSSNATNVTLTGLNPLTNYTITVNAMNGDQVVGAGSVLLKGTQVFLPNIRGT